MSFFPGLLVVDEIGGLYGCSDLPHSADPAEIEDLEQFLGKVLPAEETAGL